MLTANLNNLYDSEALEAFSKFVADLARIARNRENEVRQSRWIAPSPGYPDHIVQSEINSAIPASAAGCVVAGTTQTELLQPKAVVSGDPVVTVEAVRKELNPYLDGEHGAALRALLKEYAPKGGLPAVPADKLPEYLARARVIIVGASA